MLSARTAKSNRKIALPFLDVVGQQELEHIHRLIQKHRRLGKVADILRDSRVLARQLAKLRYKMRIRQKANIEDEIGLRRHAVLEPEAIRRDSKVSVVLLALKLRADVRAQVVHSELRRVEHDISDVADGVQTLPLSAYRLNHRIGAAHGMRPPGLREASYQRILARLEIENPCGQHPANLFEDRRELVQPHALADIHDQGGALDLRRLPHQVRKARHQFQRQVVYRVEAEVFKGLQRRELSRTR